MLIYIRQRISYFRAAFLYFSSALVSAFLGVAINPVLARNLSHEDYVLIGYFTSFQVLLIPIVSFGFNSFLLRRFHDLSESERPVLINTLFLSMALVGFFGVAIFLVVLYLFFVFRGVDLPFFPVAVFVFLQTYFAALFNLYLTKLKILRFSGRYALAVILGAVINAGAAYLFVVDYKLGAEGKLGAAMLASMIGALAAVGGLFNKKSWNSIYLKEGWRFGLPLTLSGVFWYCLVGLDKSLLMSLGDSYNYGNYVVAAQVAGYFMFFYTAANNVCESDIFLHAGRKDYRRLTRVIAIVLGSVVLVNFSLYLAARVVVDVLTGGAYVDAYYFARIFAIQNVVMSFYYVVVQLLVAFGLVKEELFVRVLGVVISVPVLYFSVASYGFLGAAWGQVAGFLVMVLLGLFVIRLRVFSEREGNA